MLGLNDPAALHRKTILAITGIAAFIALCFWEPLIFKGVAVLLVAALFYGIVFSYFNEQNEDRQNDR